MFNWLKIQLGKVGYVKILERLKWSEEIHFSEKQLNKKIFLIAILFI